MKIWTLIVSDSDSREEPAPAGVFGQVRSSLRCSVATWVKRHSFWVFLSQSIRPRKWLLLPAVVCASKAREPLRLGVAPLWAPKSWSSLVSAVCGVSEQDSQSLQPLHSFSVMDGWTPASETMTTTILGEPCRFRNFASPSNKLAGVVHRRLIS